MKKCIKSMMIKRTNKHTKKDQQQHKKFHNTEAEVQQDKRDLIANAAEKRAKLNQSRYTTRKQLSISNIDFSDKNTWN